MNDDRRNYLLVGVFVLAMIAGLVLWLSALAGPGGEKDHYVIHYRNVLGLTEGSEVFFEGYPVGVIERIEPVFSAGNPHFRVEIGVSRGWPIPEDSRARITVESLLSRFLLDIDAGESETLLQPGDEITGLEQANIMDAMAGVAEDVSRLITESLQPLLAKFDERVPEILEGLDSFVDKLNHSANQINELLSSSNAGHVSNILGNLESTTESFASVSEGLSDTRSQLEGVIAALHRLLDEHEGEIPQAAEDLHHTLEAVASSIDAITHNLEESTRNLSEFSDHIRRDPSLLIRGRNVEDEVSP